jgi:hypothetical protein
MAFELVVKADALFVGKMVRLRVPKTTLSTDSIAIKISRKDLVVVFTVGTSSTHRPYLGIDRRISSEPTELGQFFVF